MQSALLISFRVVKLMPREAESKLGLVWVVDVPDGLDVRPGWRYDGNQFIPNK